jgi:hypothetical protein
MNGDAIAALIAHKTMKAASHPTGEGWFRQLTTRNFTRKDTVGRTF